VIGQHGVCVDNIDVKAATEQGVLVVTVPAISFMSVAEHAVMMMLGLARRIIESDAAVRKDDFQFRERFCPSEINGKTLFALGLGRIGIEVAKKCRLGFNMEVLAYNAYVSELEMASIGVKKVNMDKGLREADVVSIHLPLTEETRHIIGKREISLRKPNAFLISVSRGGVVKQNDLVQTLKPGKIMGAGLDVLDTEPPKPGDPILDLPKLILSPHSPGTHMMPNRGFPLAWPRESLRP